MKKRLARLLLCFYAASILLGGTCGAQQSSPALGRTEVWPNQASVEILNPRAGLVALCCFYDEAGRMVDVQERTLSESEASLEFSSIADYTHVRVFLLDEDRSPLCPAAVGAVDGELLRGEALGLPLENAHRTSLSPAEYMALLDLFVAYAAPDRLIQWQGQNAAYREATGTLNRMDAMVGLFLAAQFVGGEYQKVHFAPEIGHLKHSWEDRSYVDGTLYDAHLWEMQYDIGAGTFWGRPEQRDGMEGSAYYYTLGRKSFYSNDFLFSIDWDSATLRLLDACTYEEALLSIIRLVDSDQKAELVSRDSSQVSASTLDQTVLANAAQMPDASYNSLPDWHGVTLCNLVDINMLASMQAQRFDRQDIEDLASLGFNFIRVPLDGRYIFPEDAPGQVRLDRLENMDDLIRWCAEFGVHVCFDIHSCTGFTTDEKTENDTIWGNEDEQALFADFWAMLAQRYQDVPNSLLSFNLMNEPNGIDEASYVALMRKAIEAIRVYTPTRLIFVDMMNTARDPIPALAEDKVAQAFHFYEPRAITHAFDGGGQWPAYRCKGSLYQVDGVLDFSISGSLPAGTTITFQVDSIHKSGTLITTADSKTADSWAFGHDAVGENGCVAVYEVGTDGEYRDYYRTWTVTLEDTTQEVRVCVEGDCYWLGLRALTIQTPERTYRFDPQDQQELLPDGTTMDQVPNPHIVLNSDGSLTDSGDVMFSAVDAAYLHNAFQAYKDFSEEYGVAVMLQEFGTYNNAPYDMAVDYTDALLDAADATGLTWCGYDYFGVFSFYAVAPYEQRSGATQTPFSKGWLAQELYQVYRDHQSSGADAE